MTRVHACMMLTCAPFPQLLFHLTFLPTSFVYFPYALVRALIPFLRPHRRWSIESTVAVLMTRLAIKFMVLFKMQPIQPRENGWREKPGVIGTTLALLNELGPGGRVAHPIMAAEAASKKGHKQDAKHARHDRVWFDPPPLDYYRGILTLKTGDSDTTVERVQDCDTYNGPAMVDMKWAKVRTRAFWFMPGGMKQQPPSKSKGGQKEPVTLYFHGGAGVTFSAADIFMGITLAANLAKSSKMPVFSVDYYLAPFAPYPVPIIQALGAYIHLTEDLGYRPDQIFVGGDSFGAHLALSLERFLRLEVPKIKGDVESQSSNMAGLLLFSPWMTAVNAHYMSRPDNLKYDIITLSFGDWGLDAMKVGPHYEKRCSLSLVDPWLSPVNKKLDEIKEMPPMFVSNGKLETLHDEGVEFVAKAREAGADVTHLVVPLQVHDFFTLPTALPDSNKVYRQFGDWARKRLASTAYRL